MKNKYTFILAILLGIIFGAFLGDLLGEYPNFKWLKYGQEIGLNPPFNLNLYIIELTIGFKVKLTIASIIGILTSMFVFKKV